MKHASSSCLFTAILFAAIGLASCGGDSPASPSTPASPANPAPATGSSVSIVRGAASMTTNAFAPNPLTVAVGTTITWVNNDTITHDATADNHAFATGNISPGASASATLQTPGRITYACTIHPGMTGVITVQ